MLLKQPRVLFPMLRADLLHRRPPFHPAEERFERGLGGRIARVVQQPLGELDRSDGASELGTALRLLFRLQTQLRNESQERVCANPIRCVK